MGAFELADPEVDKNGMDLANRTGDGTVDYRGRPADRRTTGGWRAACFVHALVVSDTISTFGIGGNLVPYAISVLHLSIAEASNAATNYIGIAYLLPLFWGYLADSYLGRFRVIWVSLLINLTGLVVLTLSVSLKSLIPEACIPTATAPCPVAKTSIQNMWYTGLTLIAVGSGGLKPCLASMGQDQFDDTDPEEEAKGKHWFESLYVAANFGGVLATTLFFYLQTSVSYGKGYAAIVAVCSVAAIAFVSATRILRNHKPGGSPLTRLTQVVFVALKNFNKRVPADVNELHEIDGVYANRISHTPRLTFFDKAAVVPDAPAKHELAEKTSNIDNSWEVCTVTQVEEFKRLLQILPIWATAIVVYCVFAQVQGVTVEQAVSLDRKLGPNFEIPAASFTAFLVASTLLFIPFWMYVVVPSLRKLTGHPKGLSPLQQMSVALFLSLFAMASAALVEGKRVRVIKDSKVNLLLVSQNQATVPMSAFYLLPQYALLGGVEFLLGSAQFRFFYQETPIGMKNLAASLTLTSVSVGYFTSSALVNAVNKYTKKTGGWLHLQFYSGGLRNYYWLLCIAMGINLCIFVSLAFMYKYKAVDNKEEREQTIQELQDTSVAEKPQALDEAS